MRGLWTHKNARHRSLLQSVNLIGKILDSDHVCDCIIFVFWQNIFSAWSVTSASGGETFEKEVHL